MTDRAPEKDNFVANVEWFNWFFEDLRYLLDEISATLASELGLQPVSYYYPKSNHQPSVPDYWLRGMRHEHYALQIFFVLQPSILEQPLFKREPSFVLVTHGRSDRALYPDDYGLRVMSNSHLDLVTDEASVLRGTFRGGEADGINFAASQVLIDVFMEAAEAKAAVRSVILPAVRQVQLPPTSGSNT